MKTKTFFLILAIVLIAGNMWAQNVQWLDDFEAVKSEAKSSGKYIFLNFSGSDWCIWCKRLASEVLDQQDFQNYAKDNLILAIADFPRGKKQSVALKAQNEKLAKEYGIQGFPTVLILDPDGKLVFQTGYRPGGAKPYVDHVKEIIKNHESKS